jgi:hypothetical protein
LTTTAHIFSIAKNALEPRIREFEKAAHVSLQKEIGNRILQLQATMPQTIPSFNSLESSIMHEKESTYSPDDRSWSGQKLLLGLRNTMSSTNIFKCEGPIHELMIICLSCNGLMPSALNRGYGLYWKTAIASLGHGEKMDIAVCRCSQATFKAAMDPIPVADKVRYGHTKGAAKANEYQVGGNHYKSEIQHWDYVLANEIPYLEAMVIKYLTRWRKKDGVKDVLKAYHFMLKLAESLELNLSPPAQSGTEKDADPSGEGYVGQGRGL